MGLARSTYYDEPEIQPIDEARLVEQIKEVCAEWLEGGREAIRAMRLKDPAQFVRVAVMALPRHVKLEADEGPFTDMGNAELRRLVELLREAMAARAIENGVEGEQAAIGPQPPLLLPAA